MGQSANRMKISDAVNLIAGDLWSECEYEYKHRGLNSSFNYFSIYPVVPQYIFRPADIKMINRIVTNHSFCNMNFERMNAAPSPLCETCDVEENVDHILYHCRRIITNRDLHKFIGNSRSTQDFINKNEIDKLLLMIVCMTSILLYELPADKSLITQRVFQLACYGAIWIIGEITS